MNKKLILTLLNIYKNVNFIGVTNEELLLKLNKLICILEK